MNFQNIPRKDKVVKRAFVPKLDALLYFDYSQIEFLLLGYYCHLLGDTSITDAMKAGKDLHIELAKNITGREADEISDSDRQKYGKTPNYAMIYGGGKPTIVRQLEVSWQEAGRIIGAFHKQWPGVALLTARINDTLDTRGYIKTPWGRHLHPRSRHSALNTLIQGSAADLKRAAMVKVHHLLTELEYESHLVLEVHDELQVDARESEIPFMVQAIPQFMDYEPISKVIQIETDCEITHTNWAEKTSYE